MKKVSKKKYKSTYHQCRLSHVYQTAEGPRCCVGSYPSKFPRSVCFSYRLIWNQGFPWWPQPHWMSFQMLWAFYQIKKQKWLSTRKQHNKAIHQSHLLCRYIRWGSLWKQVKITFLGNVVSLKFDAFFLGQVALTGWQIEKINSGNQAKKNKQCIPCCDSNVDDIILNVQSTSIVKDNLRRSSPGTHSFFKSVFEGHS